MSRPQPKPQPKPTHWNHHYYHDWEYPYYPYYWYDPLLDDDYYYLGQKPTPKSASRKSGAYIGPLPPNPNPTPTPNPYPGPTPKPMYDDYYYEWTTMDAYAQGFKDGFDAACQMMQNGTWPTPTPTPEPMPEPVAPTEGE